MPLTRESRMTVTALKRSTDALVGQHDTGFNVRCWRRRTVRTLLIAVVSVFTTFSFLFLSSATDGGGTIHAPALFKPTTYQIVPGYFAQSLNSTDDATFDYTKSNFGLLDSEGKIDNSSDRWIRFAQNIAQLTANASSTESYKGMPIKMLAKAVLFLARHGEGYHNTAEAYYGTPAWNCYWSEQYGNGTTSWGPDALLTPNGIQQALAANAAWKLQLNASIPLPQRFLSSPLSRAASTLNLTWSDIALHPFPFANPTFIESLRESIGLHTCDQRRSKNYLHNTYPVFLFEPGFRETDELWGPVYQETSAQQTVRLRGVLDSIWANERGTYISVTAHGGTVAAILANIGHREWMLQTGGMIPVVVKGMYTGPTTTSTMSLTSATAPGCTDNPSIIPTGI